jgi:hypothetical protein
MVDVSSGAPLGAPRKDTAAYASLSFFTCQRAASEDAICFQKKTTPHTGISGLSRQPVRKTSELPSGSSVMNLI